MSTLDLEGEMDQYICIQILEHIRDEKELDFDKLVEDAGEIYTYENIPGRVQVWIKIITATEGVTAEALAGTEEKAQ